MEKSYNTVFSQRQRFCFAKKFHKLICFSAVFISFFEHSVKDSNSKNFLGRDIFKNVKINYSIYFQDQKKKTLKTHACCILDAFVIHRYMKNSKNNAQFSPSSYVPILVCDFSNIYNYCYIYQMFCFVCFFFVN